MPDEQDDPFVQFFTPKPPDPQARLKGMLQEEIGNIASAHSPVEIRNRWDMASSRLGSEFPTVTPEKYQSAVMDAADQERKRQRYQAAYQEAQRSVPAEGKASVGYIGPRLPVLGLGFTAAEAAQLYHAGRAIDDGTASDRDYQRVAESVVGQEEAKKRGLGEQTFDLATQLPAIVADWALTGGAGGGARAGAESIAENITKGFVGRGAETLAGRIGARAVGTAAEAVGRSAVAAPLAVPGGTMERLAEQPQKAPWQAAGEAALAKTIETSIFSSGHFPGMGESTAKTVVGRLLAGAKDTVAGVLTGQAAEEGQYQAGLSSQPSELRRIGQPGARQSLEAQLLAFGLVEGLKHSWSAMEARGLDPAKNPDDLVKGAQAAFETFQAQPKPEPRPTTDPNREPLVTPAPPEPAPAAQQPTEAAPPSPAVTPAGQLPPEPAPGATEAVPKSENQLAAPGRMSRDRQLRRQGVDAGAMAIDLGVPVQDLHDVADSIIKQDADVVAQKNEMLKDARDALGEFGGTHRLIQARQAKGGRSPEDAASIHGLDEVAEQMAKDHPALFRPESGENGSISDQLFGMLQEGKQKPISLADAYNQAERQIGSQFTPSERQGFHATATSEGHTRPEIDSALGNAESEVAGKAGQARGEAWEPPGAQAGEFDPAALARPADPRHQQILEGRVKGDTLEDVGGRLSLTRQRVKQLQDKALASLDPTEAEKIRTQIDSAALLKQKDAALHARTPGVHDQREQQAAQDDLIEEHERLKKELEAEYGPIPTEPDRGPPSRDAAAALAEAQQIANAQRGPEGAGQAPGRQQPAPVRPDSRSRLRRPGGEDQAPGTGSEPAPRGEDQGRASAEAGGNAAAPADAVPAPAADQLAAPKGKLWEYADQLEKGAADRLKKKFGGDTLFSTPFDPETISDLAKYTAAKIIKAGYSFTQFSKDIVARFGEAVKPHLQTIWSQAQDHLQGPDEHARITGIKNEAVDAELARMGLPPAVHGKRWTTAELWQAAKDKLAADPDAGRRLADDLTARNRPLTKEEGALAALEIRKRSNEWQNAEDLLNAASGPDKEAARVRAAMAQADYKKAADAFTKAGSENAGGLAIRAMMLKEDYSIASMERTRRAAKGEALTDPEREKLAEQSRQINVLQARLDAQEAMRQRAPVERQMAPGRKTPARKELDDAWADFKQKAGRMFTGVDPELVISAAKLAKAAVKFGIENVREFLADAARVKGSAIKPESEQILRDAWDKAQGEATQEKADRESVANEKVKAGIFEKTQELRDRTAAGDFAKPEPAPARMPDKELQSLRADLAKAQKEFQIGNRDAEMANRPTYQKALGVLATWYRGISLLSSPVIVGKLTTAALWRQASTPVEGAIGAAWGKAIPGVYKKAVYERNLPLATAARDWAQGFMRMVTDAKSVIKTGEMDIGHMHGEMHGSGEANTGPAAVRGLTAAAEFFGRLHAALKTVPKRAAFESAIEKGTRAAMEQGLDPTDPLVQTRLGVEAYEQANRSIFMRDNWISDLWKNAMLPKIDPATGQQTPGSAIKRFAGGMLFPITKVPTNLAIETFHYAFGTIEGAGLAAHAYVKGIESLKPEQADHIMRLLKKGTVGAAVMALGYWQADSIGGYYQHGQKRDENDVPVGGLRIFGWDVPRWMVHNPLLEMLQFGATIRRVSDSRLRKRDTEPQGVGEGVFKAVTGLGEEVPFVRESLSLSKLAEPHGFSKVVGEKVKSTIPGLVQSGAALADNPYDVGRGHELISGQTKRSAESIGEQFQSGIPWWRNQLPTKEQAAAQKKQDAKDARLLNPGSRKSGAK